MATIGSLLGVTQFARKVGVSPQRIRKLIKDGRLRADKYGNKFWLIHPMEIEEFKRNRN